MGPDQLPTRPRFHWDLRNAPWTDGRGPQELFYRSVVSWKNFHDKLPDGNSHKIPPSLQGVILQSQLYDRAQDLVQKLTSEQIESDDGALQVAAVVYKRDVLSVVTDTFHQFMDVLQTKQGDNESFQNFETRFDAQVCKLNATCSGAELPPALLSFMLLANSRIDSAQRVSILVASSPTEEIAVDADMKDILNKLSYEKVASIVRACDEPSRLSASRQRYTANSFGATTAAASSSKGSTTPRKQKQKLTPAQLADLKSKCICRRCKQKGHWASDTDVCPMASATSTPSQGSSGSTHNANGAQQTTRGTKPNTVTFHMSTLETDYKVGDKHEPSDVSLLGPILDDAAPYSGMGIIELSALAPSILTSWNGSLDPLPSSIQDTPFWQYGRGSHASQRRKILGSVMLSAKSDEGNTIEIRHLIVEGSSQWVIGKNVTQKSNILHLDQNKLQFRLPSSQINHVSLIEDQHHSHVPFSTFIENDSSILSDECLSMVFLSVSSSQTRLPWSEIKRIIDKVHRHVCGHSSYEDIKLLLQRNDLWSIECSKYLSQILESCVHCHVVDEPSGNRRVSLHSMSRNFNDLVCIDHFFPDNQDVIHFMDSTTRYSGGVLVPSTNMQAAIIAFEESWIGMFWPPASVQGDQAFDNDQFKSYLKLYDIRFRPAPPRRHSKNVLESKHRILRDLYLRLKSDLPDEDPRLRVAKMFRISNDLYGNNVASAHEQAKGYTRPVTNDFPKFVSQDLLSAQQVLSARRNLNLILKSKSIRDKPVQVGDIVQIYTRLPYQKRGTWSDPRTILEYLPESQTVIVAGTHGRRRKAAIEDTRFAISENELGKELQAAIDELETDIHDMLPDVLDDISDTEVADDSSQPSQVNPDSNSDSVYSDMMSSHESTDQDVIDQNSPSELNEEQLEVVTYTPTVPSTFDPDEHADTNGSTGRSSHPPAASIHSMRTRSSTQRNDLSGSMESDEIELLPGTELSSTEQSALQEFFGRFQSKEFLMHEAEGLPSFILQNAYRAEEDNFIKHCTPIHASKIPPHANVIRSHVLYKIKRRDDGSLTCKARIAPHGNEDSEKRHLKTDSACCPPVGMRILFSLCAIFQWYMTKIDIKGAFLQSGEAQRDVYVVPPRESSNRQFTWLLLVAAYGLVNANAKWQAHSDQTLLNLGFRTLVNCPQLFFVIEKGSLSLVLVKVTDDLLLAGSERLKRSFIKKLSSVYDIGTITHLPGFCWFYGLQLSQEENYETCIHADHKLGGLSSNVLSRSRRKLSDDSLTTIELSKFNSLNGSIGFVGVHASPLASFISSYLQQKRNSAKVKDLALQNTLLRSVISFGSTTTYRKPSTGTFAFSLLTFADAARPSENGQLGFIVGLLIGEFCRNSVFHPLHWRSSVSRRPVRSTGAADTLAAGAAVDESILIAKSLSILFDCDVPITVVVDSKDLFDSLTSCHVPEDKMIRADVGLIRYYFETHQIDKIMWIPGSTNLADPLTKRDSSLQEALQLLMFDGRLPFNFSDTQGKSSTMDIG